VRRVGGVVMALQAIGEASAINQVFLREIPQVITGACAIGSILRGGGQGQQASHERTNHQPCKTAN